MSFNRSGYIGRAPGDSSVTIARKSYEPTGVQTDFTFSAGYDPGYCDVYLNGIRLVKDNDFTASDGSTVGLTSAANSGDIVEIIAYKAFNLGQSITDITGDLTITDTLTATNVSGTTSVTAGYLYGDGSNITGLSYAGIGITQYIDANSLTVTGTPGLSTITRLGATDAVVTGIITANGLSGNVSGAACTFTTGTFNGNVSIAGTLSYQDVTDVDAVGLITARSGVNITGGEFKVGTAVTIGSAGIITSHGGTIDLKNSGSVSNIKFYCESGNSHYTALQSAAHSAYGGNVTVTLPTTTDTLVARTTTDTLTNKTLTSPTLTTPVFSGAATGELKVGSGITIASTSGVATFADGSDTTNALKFGSGGDLTIYHDGSHSHIVSDTGNLRILADGAGDLVLTAKNGEESIVCSEDGAVDLHYDNATKLITTNDGVVITGIGTFSGGIDMPDDAIAVFGTNDDLKIRHTNNNSIISHNGAGDLLINTAAGEKIYIDTAEVVFRNAASDETIIKGTENSDVELYYDNSLKFATTYDGVVVTGIATVSQGLNTDGLLSEKFNTTAGKLSDNTNIDLENGMVHYFSTQESTTSTPNIRYSSSKSLNNMLSIGDAITVTIITTAASGGYSAQLTIDGSAVTEDWVGGSAPSAGGSDGLDIYVYTILKTASATYKVIGNLTNAT